MYSIQINAYKEYERLAGYMGWAGAGWLEGETGSDDRRQIISDHPTGFMERPASTI